MRPLDWLAMTMGSVRAGRLRARLTVVGIAVGIAAVVLLTALGEGVRSFVLGEFTRFGTNVISITPGSTRTRRRRSRASSRRTPASTSPSPESSSS